MMKLALKIVGFIVFMLLFGCISVGVFLVSFGWLDPYNVFPGLPEPPTIDTGGLPLPEEIANEEFNGWLVDAQRKLAALRPGESVVLGEYVERRPLVRAIPTPQQVSTAPQIIGANVLLAMLMALIFGVCSTMLSNMFAEEEERMERWLQAYGIKDVVNWVRNAFNWSANRAVKQGCLTLPLVLAIFISYGILFAFLESGTSLFSLEGAALVATMAFSVGLVSLSGDFANRIMSRIWRTESRFHLYPVNLLVAAVTVVFSRLLSLSPGIVFGTPGGADIDLAPAVKQRREMTLAYVTLGVIITLGTGGWLLSGLVLILLDGTMEARLAVPATWLLTSVQNTALLLFLVALETLFFETLPMAYGTGRNIFERNKFVWALLFLPVAFTFNHVLLNPQSGFLDSFTSPNVRAMWIILVGIAGLTAALWFYFNIVDDVLQEWVGLKPRRRVRPQ